MRIIRVIENKIGGQWIGITFHTKDVPVGNNLPKTLMRLCEAIGKSYKNKLILTREFINCPGACRSLGWLSNNNDYMVQKLAEKAGVSASIARNVINSTPYIKNNIAAITIGDDENPDVVLSYAHPDVVMKLVRIWQKISGTDLNIDVSTVMAVCGNVVAKAYITGKICISFGCPDSRKYGCIENNKLIIGVPSNLIEYLF